MVVERRLTAEANTQLATELDEARLKAKVESGIRSSNGVRSERLDGAVQDAVAGVDGGFVVAAGTSATGFHLGVAINSLVTTVGTGKAYFKSPAFG